MSDRLNPLRKGWLLCRHLGPGWVAFRARYAMRRRLGGLERATPACAWEDIEVPESEPLLGRLFAAPAAVGAEAVKEADEVLSGRFRLFSHHLVETGERPAWNRNWLTGALVPAEVHWSRLGDFRFGDIKAVWELSRFPWAFALARAYAKTGDERYAERFWTLFEDWLTRNPPNRGPNWMCGQEATFRLMAATFARHVCADAAATTDERIAKYRQFVVATGARIAGNLDYALSQSNNHGVSECVGLITTATLVPEAAEANAWRRRGLAKLEQQLAALVYPDGAFAQHSAMYHRVLLHDLCWAVSLFRAANQRAPDWLLGCGRRALEFIATLMDAATGRVPVYGANDGSNVLPLADADYLDFRPVVQMGYAVLHDTRRLREGPWDEAGGWLAPEAALSGTRSSTIDEPSGAPFAGSFDSGSSDEPGVTNNGDHRYFPDGGVLLWHRGETGVFFRCPTRFRHRPSQADLLHVDLEWRGQPIAIDAGTYSYNASGTFAGGLKEAMVHNAVTFDGQEPMEKIGRFLYLPWPHGSAEFSADRCGFMAAHDGWARLGIRHTRCVECLDDGTVAIEDRVSSAKPRRARLHWLLGDHDYELAAERSTLRLETDVGACEIKWEAPHDARVTLVRADPDSNRGWWSPHYCELQPALSLAIEFEFTREARVATVFRPVSASVQVLSNRSSVIRPPSSE